MTNSSDDTDPTGKNSMVNIHTRSTSEEALVSYPVHVYVFDKKNSCVATTVIESEETPMSIALTEGLYTIHAVGGISSDSYDIPGKSDASPESVVKLLDGKNHSDIMAATNTIQLEEGEVNTLTLYLKRKVMLLQDVVIYNVPSTVSEVSVTMAPFAENICINGAPSDGIASHTKSLSKVSGTKTWSNNDELFMIANSESVTITVTMKYADGTKSYSYTCPDRLLANYKVKIYGAYTEELGVTLNGTITGEEWAGEKEISFSFDESGSTDGIDGDTNNDDNNSSEGDDTSGDNTSGDNTETEGEDNTVNSSVPAVGSFYNDCYVLSHQTNSDNTTTVTLLSSKTVSLKLASKEQSEIKSTIDNALSSFTLNSITGWRLINSNDLAAIKANRDAINAEFTSNGFAQAFITNNFFYYQKSADEIMIFTFNADGTTRELSPSGTNYLRPVATVTFTGE